MSCSADASYFMQLDSLSMFSDNLLNIFFQETNRQQNRINDHINAFNDAAQILRHVMTIPDAEAVQIECLEHIDRIEALLAEYKAVLDQVDVDLLIQLINAVPELAGDPDEVIRPYVEDLLDGYHESYSEMVDGFSAKRMREWVDAQVTWVRDFNPLEEGEIREEEQQHQDQDQWPYEYDEDEEMEYGIDEFGEYTFDHLGKPIPFEADEGENGIDEYEGSIVEQFNSIGSSQ